MADLEARKGSTVHAETVAVETSAPGKDKAAILLEQAGRDITVTAADNKRVLRQIDWAILPIILFIYCLQSLDKSSLSYASVFGLIPDLNLVGSQFSWAGAIVYVAQLVWQPLIAYILVKFPIGKFMAVMVLCWGTTLCGMVAAKEFGGLMAARFMLGTFEASVAPTFVAIVQMWYRRSEQTNRNAAWYSMLGVVNILGSLLSYGLAKIQSNVLRPWQTIFLFCGLLTVTFSVLVFIYLPDSPMKARFLKGDDKLIAIERLRMNQMGVSSGVWRWDQVRECLLDVKTWLWFCLITTIAIPSGGISTFGPLILKSYVNDSFSTLLLNMPFGAVQLVATLGAAWAATRWQAKTPILMLLCIPPIIGLAILLAFEHIPANRGPLLFGYYIISIYPAISPIIYSLAAQNTAGHTKRSLTNGMVFIGQSVGNIIGPNLYTPAEAPAYARGLRSNLALFVVLIVLALLTNLYLRHLNRRHAAERQRLGKAAVLVDASMVEGRKLDAAATSVTAAKVEGVAGVGRADGGMEDEAAEPSTTATATGQKAFEDVTDLRNEEFIYVY